MTSDPSAPFVLDHTNLRDLAPDVIDDQGLPRVMPASYYAETTIEERAWLGHRFGLYNLPTIELCDWLVKRIDGRKAIEIGAGNGRMAERVGIEATDSFLQDSDDMRALYALTGQPCITYGPNVRKLEAQDAVRRLHPEVVIGAWVTHRYNRRRPSLGGNMYGPNMEWIFERVEEYVLIGNTQVHASNPLFGLPHTIHHFPFLYSRAHNGSPDFVAIWKVTR